MMTVNNKSFIMKKIKFLLLPMVMIMTIGCTKFFDVAPQGVASPALLKTKAGVNAVLIGAYSLLDGVGAGTTQWHGSADNWVFGGVASDDAVKGTDAGDQPEQSFIEQYNWLADNTHFRGKWQAVYDGISRSNEAIIFAKDPEVKDMTDAEKTQVIAQARFLRAHYHFEAKKMWNNVPYIDETKYDRSNPAGVLATNTSDIWPQIEADFKFAADNLPATQAQKGRATKWAALAYLGKTLVFQKKWAAAKTALLDVYNNSGKSLVKEYHDNFRTATNNNTESIFEVQFSINDGTGGQNGNKGATLNWPYTAASPGRGCCGFYLPSHNLVNAFRTGADGLPLIGDAADGSKDTYNNVDVPNDQGLTFNQAWTYDNTEPVDPRLDWTVGRRGVNFLDWGKMPGSSWIRDQGYSGPFTGKKWMYYVGEEGSTTHATDRRSVNNNYRLIRFSAVILWLAECEVELGNLAQAETYVNLIRNRAKASKPQDATINTKVEPYTAGTFAAKGADFARNAVRMETRLEFGMEGHRFFDLVRWGIAEKVLNAYIAKESVAGKGWDGRSFNKRAYMVGRVFAAKNNYFPIPADEILNSQKDGKSVLTQNPGY
jgi:hypothetical protein